MVAVIFISQVPIDSIAQSVASLIADLWSYTFVEIDREIFSMCCWLSYKRMNVHRVLVNRLLSQAIPGKSVVRGT